MRNNGLASCIEFGGLKSVSRSIRAEFAPLWEATHAENIAALIIKFGFPSDFDVAEAEERARFVPWFKRFLQR